MTTLLNLVQVVATFIGNFFYEFIMVPAKAILSITLEYMADSEMSLLAYLGFFVITIAFAQGVRAFFKLIRELVAHLFFIYKEKKRAKIREIRRQERLRTEARIADNMAFDKMYEMYGNK